MKSAQELKAIIASRSKEFQEETQALEQKNRELSAQVRRRTEVIEAFQKIAELIEKEIPDHLKPDVFKLLIEIERLEIDDQDVVSKVSMLGVEIFDSEDY